MLMRPTITAVTARSSRRQFPKSGADLNNAMKRVGTRIPYARNEEIFGDGEPTQYFYKIVSGCARSYKILDDGRRQIIGFHMPGDVFGLELTENHHFSAEAVNDTIILAVKRSAIMRLAMHDADISRQLWAITARELQRVKYHTRAVARESGDKTTVFGE
jgi:CRP/FNR family transcriptional regulator, nitrogen fixation regulation protein